MQLLFLSRETLLLAFLQFRTFMDVIWISTATFKLQEVKITHCKTGIMEWIGKNCSIILGKLLQNKQWLICWGTVIQKHPVFTIYISGCLRKIAFLTLASTSLNIFFLTIASLGMNLWCTVPCHVKKISSITIHFQQYFWTFVAAGDNDNFHIEDCHVTEVIMTDTLLN